MSLFPDVGIKIIVTLVVSSLHLRDVRLYEVRPIGDNPSALSFPKKLWLSHLYFSKK